VRKRLLIGALLGVMLLAPAARPAAAEPVPSNRFTVYNRTDKCAWVTIDLATTIVPAIFKNYEHFMLTAGSHRQVSFVEEHPWDVKARAQLYDTAECKEPFLAGGDTWDIHPHNYTDPKTHMLYPAVIAKRGNGRYMLFFEGPSRRR
jgi:hypothetical protein